jgi:hypothetical protein
VRKLALTALPCLLIAVAALTYVFAQPALDTPYEFKLGADITADAAEVAIQPAFKALADDRFAYDIYFNATRSGSVRDGDKSQEGFRRAENWITMVTLTAKEDALDGRKDLLLRLNYDQLGFLIDNGAARYSGYVGPARGTTTAAFHEVTPNGERNEANNIPGWPGVTARGIESARSSQTFDPAGSAWFSVNDQGRLYNETYFADFNNADQRNYPGRFQDPLHLTLGLLPEFAEGASLKIGETTTVRRRFPVSTGAGSTIEYDFTYKLERLYGTVAEPTAARFTFTAVPVQREHTHDHAGLRTTWTAPDIKDGTLLFDLGKGIAAATSWKYELAGTVTQTGGSMRTEFKIAVDFAANLRAPEKK